MDEVYKLTTERKGRYYSAMVHVPGIMVEYEWKKWASAKIEGSPLYAFDNEQSAKYWAWVACAQPHPTLWVCEYELFSEKIERHCYELVKNNLIRFWKGDRGMLMKCGLPVHMVLCARLKPVALIHA